MRSDRASIGSDAAVLEERPPAFPDGHFYSPVVDIEAVHGDQNRIWNEQYLLRALLMGSRDFEILFGCSYAHFRFPELVRQCLRGKLFGGRSLWLRRA